MNNYIKLYQQIAFLIGSKNRIKLIPILILNIFSIFTELLSVGIVIPLLSILIEPNYLRNISFPLELDFKEFNILKVLILFCFFLLLSSFVKIYAQFFTNKYSADIGITISNIIFKNFLYDYLKTKKIDSSSISSAILMKTNELIGGYVQAFIMLSTSIIFLFVFLTFIYSKFPKITLFIFPAITCLFLVFVYFTKTKMFNISLHISNSSEILTHLVNESKRGLRDVHSLNLGDKLFKNFVDVNVHLRHSQAQAVTLSSLPKNVIEPFAIIFLLLSTFLYNNSDKTSFIIIEVGSIAYAIQKLLPYLQQIYSSITNIRGSYYSVTDVVKLAFVKISPVNMLNQNKYLSFDSIVLQKVCFSYGNQLILDNVDLTIVSGDSILIKGNTGSGKSTLIDVITGLIEPSSGIVFYNSIDITQNKLCIANNVSFISQRVFIIKGTVYENITLGLSEEELLNITKDQLACALYISDLDSFTDGFNHFIDEDGINISGGQRQRIGIARSVLLNRNILIFDEATNALDKNTEQRVVNRLFNWKGHRTFIFISHENVFDIFCNKKFEFPSINNNK